VGFLSLGVVPVAKRRAGDGASACRLPETNSAPPVCLRWFGRERGRRGAAFAVYRLVLLVLGATAGCGRSELDDGLFVPDPAGGDATDGSMGFEPDGNLAESGVETGPGTPLDAASDGGSDAFGEVPDATADSGMPEEAGTADGPGAPADASQPDSAVRDSGAPVDSGVPSDAAAQCPAAYAGCHGAATVVPSSQAVCSRDELRSAGTECAGGAHTSGCDTFFASEQMQDPACGLCLGRFDFDFLELRGIFACVAPFVDVGCNADTGCLIDCLDQSCGGCPDRSSTSECRLSVSGRTCAPYVAGAKCVEGAFGNEGGFCDPDQYATFGEWLRAVGEQFCAQ
jgi:hypothetical protein